MKTKASNNALKNNDFTSVKEHIYELIKIRPQTLETLTLLGFKNQTASARLSELEDLGLIKSTGENLSFFTSITDPTEQRLHAQARQQTYYLNWVKRGKENGYFKKYLEDINVKL